MFCRVRFLEDVVYAAFLTRRLLVRRTYRVFRRGLLQQKSFDLRRSYHNSQICKYNLHAQPQTLRLRPEAGLESTVESLT